MVEFIDKIIFYSIVEWGFDVVDDEALAVLNNKTNQELMLKLEQNNNAITAKTQLYLSFYNRPCFQYGTADSK